MNGSNSDARDRSGHVVPEGEPVFVHPNPPARVRTLGRLSVSPEAGRALPADFVKRHRILPFEIENGTLHIATSDLGNQRVIDDIRLLSGLEVKESEAPAAEILERIAEC